ncbi:LysR family transcriptional regulator [Jannaschia marina]|uniref:LysR family transcriptional regulator n=1 Tax=Jannaschia marina TaxID=2741674 RepID=UPI0015C8D090|nr:LysR family transcriptional regulator [Jannaschia marina]
MPDRLLALTTFLRVAERGSLTAAAADLGTSQPSVTRAVAALEAELGTRLFHRTTHAVTPTEAGRMLLPKARSLVAGWDDLSDALRATDDLRGPLHVVAPVALGQTELISVLTDFRTAHPGVSVNWQLTDAEIRLAEVGADLWIRVGAVPDDRLVQRRLGTVRRSVLGHPDFMGRELKHCPWITLGPYEGRRIELAEGSFEVEPVLNTNSIAVVSEALRAGLGVAIAPEWYLRDDLAEGRLRRLGGTATALPVHLAHAPEGRSRRLSALMDAVATHMTARVLDQAGAD